MSWKTWSTTRHTPSEADVEKLEALLAGERERADKAITGFEALLSTESARADRAIAAFENLAERLEALARGGDAWSAKGKPRPAPRSTTPNEDPKLQNLLITVRGD